MIAQECLLQLLEYIKEAERSRELPLEILTFQKIDL